jgi:uncharacterized coiled-coil DUF342 family protein
MEITPSLSEMLSILKKQREDLSAAKAEYTEALQSFEEQHKMLRQRIATLADETDETEMSIRSAAIAEFKISWAVDHKMALQLDRKVFETIAKAQEMEFVKIEEVPTATIPKDIAGAP